jgi:hypothetical protein
MYEDNFILNAARLNLSEENISELKKISKKNINWPLFEKKACVHGVDTFIYYSLKNHNLSELIPSEIFKRFQKHYYEVAYQNSAFLDEVDKLSTIIDDKIVLLKGIDLIQSLYPNIAIRSMVDIDILVDSEKDLDIWNKLKINGFEELIQETFERPIEEPILKISKSSLHRIPIPINNIRCHHLPGIHNNKCVIEVHCNIFHSPHFSVESEIAWEKSAPINSNKKIFRLSNEFLLIHLCDHFYYHKHQCAILRMLCDINELILKQSNFINWSEINEISNNSELKNEITTALTYAHVLLNTPVPANFINKKKLKKNSFKLDTLLRGEKEKSHLSYYFDVLKLMNNPADRIKFIIRTLIPAKDWMNENYHAESGVKLIKAYITYWSYQIRTHIIKKEKHLGN